MSRAIPSSSKMTPEAYRRALAELDYTQEGFAVMLGAAPRTGQKWALGEARIPGSVVLLLRLLQFRPELKSVIDVMSPPAPRSRKNSSKPGLRKSS